MAALLLPLLALVAAATNTAALPTVYKVCATERVPQYTCAGLNKGNTEAACARVVDSADCVRQLVAGNAHFGVLSAEELLLASKFAPLNEQTRVIAEIRHSERLNEPFAFETVAVVKADFSGLLGGLKNKSLCHPGFSDSQLWTPRVLKHFERKVVPQTCNAAVPKVEEEYDNLADFFKDACIPGDWSRSAYRDDLLKSKHPNLCAKCDNPERCSYNTHERGSHEAALSCLTDRGGDVAYVALQYVQNYFGLKDRKPMANPSDYRFLCPNGSMQTITAATPCTWLRQPWNAVVARKDSAAELQAKIKTWLPSGSLTRSNRDIWQDHLAEIVFSSRSRLFDPAAGIVSPADYVARGRNDTTGPAPEGEQCRPSVRWCTTTVLEAEKCEVLRQGAYTYGLEPSVQCVRAASMWECLNAVQNATADIVAIDSEYSHIARNTYRLSSLIYQDTDNEHAYKILSVVRADSGIKQLSDLKKKSACFPEYGGLAWTAWVDAARSRRLLPRKCPSSAAVADYLYRACAPGADDNLHNPTGDNRTRTAMCALCPDNKDAPETSRCAISSSSNYYGDKGAMRCLNDKRGDVAFVDVRAISEEDANGQLKLLPDYRDDEYRVLCRNGSASTRLGLTVDSKCALSTGIVGEIVSRGPDATLSKDAALLLLELEYWFGYGAKHYESALNIFGSFKGVDDVLFKKSAVGFVTIFDRENLLAQDFAGLMERNQGCNLEGSGAALTPAPALVMALLAVVAAGLALRR